MAYFRGHTSASPCTRIEERNEHFAARLESIQAKSRALQNALGIYNDNPWPHPPIPTKEAVEPGVLEKNGRVIRRALDNGRLYELEMRRSSEKCEYIDMSIGSGDIPEARQQNVEEHIACGNAASQFSEGFAGLVRNEVSTTVKMVKDAAARHQEADASIPTSPVHNQHRSNRSTSNAETLDILCTPVPQPENMLDTFTHAICRYPDLEVAPILTMTLRDTTPPILSPTTNRNKMLLHFEVGLDGVDGLCQGRVRIPENLDWKKNIREPRLGRIGILKSGDGSFSAELQREQLERGYGLGWWLFFGVRFALTELERASGKGGKWVCFGFPFEASTWWTGNQETVIVGGGKDAMDQSLPRYKMEAQRFGTRFSTGGTACMDLFDGAEEWKGGVWKDVRKAMAHDSLLVSFLCSDGKVGGSKKRPFDSDDTADDASGGRKLDEGFHEDPNTQSRGIIVSNLSG